MCIAILRHSSEGLIVHILFIVHKLRLKLVPHSNSRHGTFQRSPRISGLNGTFDIIQRVRGKVENLESSSRMGGPSVLYNRCSWVNFTDDLLVFDRFDLTRVASSQNFIVRLFAAEGVPLDGQQVTFRRPSARRHAAHRRYHSEHVSSIGY